MRQSLGHAAQPCPCARRNGRGAIQRRQHRPGEAGQNIRLITFTVSGLADGASERLTIDASTIALVNNTTVTTSGLGLSVTVTVIGNTATITVSSAGISAATANGVLNGITYQDGPRPPAAPAS